VIGAVVFDLDGVLIDSESVWDDVRVGYVREQGGTWKPEAQRTMMGMSSHEWSAYLHDELGVAKPAAQINDDVVDRIVDRYRDHLPLLPGARDAVVRLAERWPLGLASSSNRPIIDAVLEAADLQASFRVVLSSEEVGRGKPHPDVYLEAVRRLDVAAGQAVAVEDSTNGLRAAHAAGLIVVAVPNRDYPPAADALELADSVIGSAAELTVAGIEQLLR
jgi:HAD superfamily hydrolase (TIGR01509 family)